MIKNIKYFMHSAKLLYGFVLFLCIPIVDNTAIANDIFSVDNININIISQDINLARKEATQKAILIGLEKLFFWKLSNKGYKIGWNSYSKVYEKSSKDRLNFYWFIKRSFGYGCSASHIYKEIFRNYSYLFLIIKIFYDLTLSIFYLILLPISPKKFFFKKIHHLARALGCAFSTFLKYNLKRY